jgi:hypothetical protein
VSYWREEPLEVDAVLEGSWGAWALEIKTGRISTSDLQGLGEFVRRYPKLRPLVICEEAARPVVERAGFESLTWTQSLLHGLFSAPLRN